MARPADDPASAPTPDLAAHKLVVMTLSSTAAVRIDDRLTSNQADVTGRVRLLPATQPLLHLRRCDRAELHVTERPVDVHPQPLLGCLMAGLVERLCRQLLLSEDAERRLPDGRVDAPRSLSASTDVRNFCASTRKATAAGALPSVWIAVHRFRRLRPVGALADRSHISLPRVRASAARRRRPASLRWWRAAARTLRLPRRPITVSGSHTAWQGLLHLLPPQRVRGRP